MKSFYRVLTGAGLIGLMFSAAVWAGTADAPAGQTTYSDVFSAKNYWVSFKNKSDRDIYLRCKKKRKTSYIFVRSDASRKKYLAKGKYRCKCAKSRHGKSKKQFKLKVSKRTKSVSVGRKCGYR